MNYTETELKEIFGSVGKNVAVHNSCVVFGGKRIHIGSNVRIDCFSLLSAGEQGITIGDYIHIAVGCYLFGSGGKIMLEDFSGISSRVSLYTGTDDFVLGYLTGPTVPEKYRKVKTGDVILKKHAVVGTGSTIMMSTLGIGASVGAHSFVKRDVPDFDIVVGTPAVRRGSRRRDVLQYEAQLRAEE